MRESKDGIWGTPKTKTVNQKKKKIENLSSLLHYNISIENLRFIITIIEHHHHQRYFHFNSHRVYYNLIRLAAIIYLKRKRKEQETNKRISQQIVSYFFFFFFFIYFSFCTFYSRKYFCYKNSLGRDFVFYFILF